MSSLEEIKAALGTTEWSEHALTVSRLIALLQTLPQDAHVVLSSDGEGNNFSPLSSYGTGFYIAETPWHGEVVGHVEDVNELISDDGLKLETDEIPPELTNAIILWPIN